MSGQKHSQAIPEASAREKARRAIKQAVGESRAATPSPPDQESADAAPASSSLGSGAPGAGTTPGSEDPPAENRGRKLLRSGMKSLR